MISFISVDQVIGGKALASKAMQVSSQAAKGVFAVPQFVAVESVKAGKALAAEAKSLSLKLVTQNHTNV